MQIAHAAKLVLTRARPAIQATKIGKTMFTACFVSHMVESAQKLAIKILETVKFRQFTYTFCRSLPYFNNKLTNFNVMPPEAYFFF